VGATAAPHGRLSLSPATRIFVALEPVDMRKSFNGLHAAVQTILDHDVLSGGLLFFTNRLNTRVKAIYWDSCEAVRNVKSRRVRVRVHPQPGLLLLT
jgi:transposase